MISISVDQRCATAFATAVLVCCLWVISARGAVVEQMTVARMADLAGQVVTGQVASVRSYWRDDPRGIETEVILREVSYLKGAHSGASTTFRLIVPGGQVGTMQMRVCCAPEFVEGDRWILFLLPAYKTFPVVGVYRGALRVQADGRGADRVFFSSGEPVVDIDQSGTLLAPGRQPVDTHRQLQVDSRVHPQVDPRARVKSAVPIPSAPSVAQAMTLRQFIDAVQPVLFASKNHHLEAPAGQRVPVSFTAATLVGAKASRHLPASIQSDASNQSNASGPSTASRGPKAADQPIARPPLVRQGGLPAERPEAALERSGD